MMSTHLPPTTWSAFSLLSQPPAAIAAAWISMKASDSCTNGNSAVILGILKPVIVAFCFLSPISRWNCSSPYGTMIDLAPATSSTVGPGRTVFVANRS